MACRLAASSIISTRARSPPPCVSAARFNSEADASVLGNEPRPPLLAVERLELRFREVELFDPVAALGDLVRGYQELVDILRSEPEMLLQIDHPVAHAPDVLHELDHLDLDLSGLFAHARVLEDRLHRLHEQHQYVGRGDDHPL